MQIEESQGFISWLRLRDLVAAHPRRAFEEGEIALRMASQCVQPRILAVMGTALRRLDDLQGAEVFLLEALQLSEQEQDRWGTADIMLRKTSVLVSIGDLNGALSSAREAGGLFAGLGCQADVGRALVSEGGVFVHLGKLLNAESCYRRALRLLPQHSRPNRSAAMSELARIQSEREQFQSAHAWASLAKKECGDDDAAVEWLQALGVFEYRAGFLEEATQTFANCRRHFLETESFLESAVSTLWLCRCHLARDRGDEATLLAQESSMLIGHLKDNPAAAAVILELVGNAVAGRKMSYRHVARLCEQMEEMGARRGRAPIQISRSDRQLPLLSPHRPR